MTIPRVGPIVASTVLASIGEFSRIPTPEKLSCNFGLTPKTRQSGDHPARGGGGRAIDQQAGKHPCAQNARRSSMVGQDGSRAFESIFRARPAQPRHVRRHCKKAGGHELARSDDERDRLHLCATRFHGNEVTQRWRSGGRSSRISQAGQVATTGSKKYERAKWNMSAAQSTLYERMVAAAGGRNPRNRSATQNRPEPYRIAEIPSSQHHPWSGRCGHHGGIG